MYLLGIDVGSSSVKVTVLDAETGKVAGSATSPKTEMEISAPQAGWAEQDPELWWSHTCTAAAEIRAGGVDLSEVAAIGISYQMHGLVVVDKDQKVLRPSIIWCDSRAVDIGNHAFLDLTEDKCLGHLLNSPGNFTAAKMGWVKQNEPDIYGKIDKMMLPGDYIAMRITGEINTTESGLSEGIMWDFKEGKRADFLLDHLGIDPDLTAPAHESFKPLGESTSAAADALGIKTGIPVSYRGGDQPNNALSLNVMNPGELATTAGTSGVVYGVGETPDYDPRSRVNTFLHVNHTADNPRYGVLMCMNGTGILNSWLKHYLAGENIDYPQMNEMAAEVPIGSERLVMLPYGNGAERTLENNNIGSSLHGLVFTTHTKHHLLRAAQEGIVFALNYGVDIMKEMGIKVNTVRAGHANMFLSPLFAATFASVTGATIELFDTDGAQGAARGAGIGAGIYPAAADAFVGLEALKTIEPDTTNLEQYREAYGLWKKVLQDRIG